MVFVCESYANNFGVRLARWERDSDSERATQKGEYEWRECKVFRLLVWSMRDACSRCCIATTHPLGSRSYCNEEFDSNSEINAEHPLFPASDIQTY